MEVYDRPATLFAARFIGSPPMNLIEAEVTNGSLTAAGGLKIAAPEGLQRGDRVIAGVRPESFTVSASDAEGARGRVVSREALGDETIYVVETEAGLLQRADAPDRPLRARSRSCPSATRARRRPSYDPQTERLAGR